MKGDKFLLAIILGLSFGSGGIFSGLAIRWVYDYQLYCFSLLMILFVNVSRRYVDNLAYPELYELVLLFLQMFSIGSCINLQIIIFGTRMKPHMIATCSEICFCVASFIASTTPTIGSMSSEFQLLYVISLCVFGISTVFTFVDENQVKIDV